MPQIAIHVYRTEGMRRKNRGLRLAAPVVHREDSGLLRTLSTALAFGSLLSVLIAFLLMEL